MDDGSLKSKDSKGVILNTQGFNLTDVELLCSVLLKKFDLQAAPRKQTHRGVVYYQIYISGHSFEHLSKLIYSHIIPEMLYKFPSPRKIRVTAPKAPGLDNSSNLTFLPKE
jgi:LAGLIDADG DNA endonuclease family